MSSSLFFYTYSIVFSFFFCQGFLQTVSNLFDMNNLRDFTHLQKVYLYPFVKLISSSLRSLFHVLSCLDCTNTALPLPRLVRYKKTRLDCLR